MIFFFICQCLLCQITFTDVLLDHTVTVCCFGLLRPHCLWCWFAFILVFGLFLIIFVCLFVLFCFVFVCVCVCVFLSPLFFFNCHDCFLGAAFVYFVTAFTLIKGRLIYHCEFRDFIPLLDLGLMLPKMSVFCLFVFVLFCHFVSFGFLFCVSGWVCVFFFDFWKLFNFEKLGLGLFFVCFLIFDLVNVIDLILICFCFVFVSFSCFLCFCWVR